MMYSMPIHVHVGYNVTCHPACMDEVLITCVPAINVYMPPLAKRQRKGNDHTFSENERSDDTIEHAPINADVDESMDSEQPSAKKQQKGDKSSPITSKKSSKQQKSSKKSHKGGEVAEQDAAGIARTQQMLF